MNVPANNAAYRKLLAEILSIHAAARDKATTTLNEIRLRMYWEIGKRIVTLEQSNKDRAGYGEETLKRLSADLTEQAGKGFSLTNIQSMRRFYLAHPSIQQISVKLAWSQHQLLLTVENDKKRQILRNKCIAQKCTVEDLKALIRQEVPEAAPPATPAKAQPRIKLPFKRGRVGLYRIAEHEMLTGETTRSLDLGFHIYYARPLPGMKELAPGSIVELGGETPSWNVTPADAAKSDLYTYRCRLLDIIDGDTIKVAIPLGVGVTRNERLRLRHVNAADRKTKRGQMAQEFLKRTFDSAGEELVIRTYGTDMYARYLVDVFYLYGEHPPEQVAREGNYLNQELLDSGLVDYYGAQG